MSVNSTHPDYDASRPAWLRARDVIAGDDAVKSAGEKNLLRLEAQTDEEYDAYRARALLFNATARTADGCLGLTAIATSFMREGELSPVLKKINAFYQGYVETFLARFVSMFEPIMLIFMGVIIGIMVVGMFLPIFQIASIGSGPSK